jgi:hypothetical protein
MKHLSILFLLLFQVVHADECVTPSLKNPNDSLDKISLIISSTELTSSEKHKKIDALNVEGAHDYLNRLGESVRNKVENLIKAIKDSKQDIIAINENEEGDPILLVQGLDFREFPSEWIIPMHSLMGKKRSSYFFKYSKYDSIETNRNKLLQVIQQLKSKHPGKELTVVGYSAGGVIALDALDKMTASKQDENINFITVAAPVFGYNAPKLAFLGAPFVGMTSIEVGRGIYNKLKIKRFEKCLQWITTSCERDPHACSREGNNPQTGKDKTSVCNSKPILINDEGHASVLNRAISEIFKE